MFVNKFTYLLLSLSVLFLSCKENKPRFPLHKNSNDTTEQSISKINIDYQNQLVKNYIVKNSNHEYINSKKGFWFYYLNKSKIKKPAITGSEIKFEYSIKNLDNILIYSKDEIGEQNYLMDKQELLTGIREALKILQEKEKAVFIFPSYKAYGIYGDYNKIAPNTPIICTIEVKSIISNN